MELLPKFLLIAVLLMLSWQWTRARPSTTPQNQPNGVSISQPDIPNINPLDILVEGIFHINAQGCPPGYIRTGPHNICRIIV
ncbi:uncharacterized protein LOC108113316 [Drosophila eugracilis]|uniref:uncharacterized protein LOC108113316 n=1 Tax=Drosophila eugracilis TaxID=29029 RepID=UPI0007E81773|nr:uncharacterized protein LOC108113316 [Drosophila eugracilis]